MAQCRHSVNKKLSYLGYSRLGCIIAGGMLNTIQLYSLKFPSIRFVILVIPYSPLPGLYLGVVESADMESMMLIAGPAPCMYSTFGVTGLLSLL